jgi:hypothetical protein
VGTGMRQSTAVGKSDERVWLALTAILFAIGATVLAGCWGDDDADDRSPAPATRLPPQGVYDYCPTGSTAAGIQVCVEQLREVREAGFEIVLNYGAFYGAPDQVRAYAKAAEELGVRLIWPFSHASLYEQDDVSASFPAMTRACGCTSPRQLIPFMVRTVKDSPATFMYYVADEPPASFHARMAANSRLVKSIDPTRPRLAVHYEPFEQTIEPYVDDVDVVAADYYPIGVPGETVDDVGRVTRELAGLASRHGRQLAMVLQAASLGPTYEPELPERWPTVDEYRAMRDQALANGPPRFILWWAAYTIRRSSDPQGRWTDLVTGAMAPPPDRARGPRALRSDVPGAAAIVARR